ncbi:MAG TPA: arsenic transporter [Firmicutes bacterium]|nr:arsenic transporter [Bacillota bacterium]
MKGIAIGIFVLTYVLLLALPKVRAYVALGAAALFVVLGILPLSEVFSAIDWNVLLMIGGTMGVVALFIESRMPSLLADLIIAKTPNVKWAIVALSLFSGVISAFVDNVATVLMVAPVALTISKKLDISPVPSVIAIAVASNLQGAATLVGDTTSILLGGYAQMDFLDFFFFKGRMGLFWVVQLGALAATVVLLFILRSLNQPISTEGRTEIKDYFPSYLLVGMIVLLILASFIPNKPAITNGLIAIGLLIIGIFREVVIKGNRAAFKDTLAEIDFFTILLLAGIFMLIGGLTEVGVIRDIANLFVRVGGDNIFVIYTLIVWASVLASAFVDNIPYVATMLPVATGIAQLLGVEPYVLYYGLLVGATLGGNLTPIGASANITALGILRKEGYEVSAGRFMRIGVPFTLSAVLTGYILVWLLWR